MNKYLVPVGMVWVGFCVVVGTVVMFDSLKSRRVTNLAVPQGNMVKEVRYIFGKDEPTPVTAGEAKVNIKGTYGESATANVKVVK